MHVDKDVKELVMLREMKSGNEGAFDFFFKYYYSRLCVFAQRMSHVSPDDAKNIVQDVFVKFWFEREKYDITHSVRSYLFTSVKNKCIDFLKQQNYRNFPQNGSLQNTATGEEPYEAFIFDELQQLFTSSLNKLPEGCRTVFELSRFASKKNAEIAEQLNISVKTVENQMTKALKILKHELHEYLPLLLFLVYSLFQK